MMNTPKITPSHLCLVSILKCELLVLAILNLPKKCALLLKEKINSMHHPREENFMRATKHADLK